MKIALSLIKPSPRPVRTTQDEAGIAELSESIKDRGGLIVPVKVRPIGDGYELVYGHRRVEAGRRAGLSEVEAIVAYVSDDDAFIEAIVENFQREDMPRLDKGRAIRALQESTGWSLIDLERHGIAKDATAGNLLAYLAEYEAGAVPDALLSNGRQGLGDDGLQRTLEIKRAFAIEGKGDDFSAKKAVAEKAIKEGLSAPQARRLAECICAAPSLEARDNLLNWEYSPVVHDPERIKDRARQFGSLDPLYTGLHMNSRQEVWDRWPEASQAIGALRVLTHGYTDFLKRVEAMTAIGKSSPEARQHIAHRLQNFRKRIDKAIALLESGE